MQTENQNEISIFDFDTMHLAAGDILLIRPREMIDGIRFQRLANALATRSERLGVKLLFLPNELDVTVLRPILNGET